MTPNLLTLTIITLAFGATSAMAGGWPNTPAKKPVAQSPAECCSVASTKDADASPAKTTTSAARQISPDGYEYVGGERVWDLAQHKLEYRNGRFVHAADCPVSIAKAGGNLKSTPGA